MLDTLPRLAVLTAIQKVIKQEIDAVRQDADEMLYSEYENSGVEKFAVRIGDEKIGEFALSFNASELSVTDNDDFEKLMLSSGFAKLKLNVLPNKFTDLELVELADKYPHAICWTTELKPSWEKQFSRKGDMALFKPTGEVVDCVKFTHKTPKNTTMRVPDVELVLRKALPGGISGLLEAGDD